MKNKINQYINISFIFIFFIIILIGFYSIVREPKLMSKNENRNLTQFPHFTLNSFIDSTFQNSFNDALADQFILGETIKLKMNQLTSFIDYRNVSSSISTNTYIKINDKNSISIFNSSDRLVYYPIEYSNELENSMKNKISQLAKLNNIYFYYINDSYNSNFSDNTTVYDIDNIFSGTKYKSLDYKNFDEFSKYFYKTDHHWNYVGSYKGYSEIATMLGIDSKEIIKPNNTHTFDLKFRGSMDRLSSDYDFYDDFTVYNFDLPEYTTYINGKSATYGDPETYYNNEFSNELLHNHYASFYGGDYGEVVYDFSNEEKDNLLIISNSFSNAINNLISSHFNKTYIVDLRHYQNAFGKEFILEEYIKQNNIDKILILGNYRLFSLEEFLDMR